MLISPLTGSVLLSEAKKRVKEAANKPYKNKDIYASINYRCNSANTDVICSTLRRQADKLLLENEEQHTEMRLKYMSPEKLTPLIASYKCVDDFLTLVYATSSKERNEQRKRAIQKSFAYLPNIPLCKIRPREVNAIIERNHIPAENLKLCHLFWEHLLQTKKCSGKNAFPESSTKEKTINTKNKDSFTTFELSDDVFAKLVAIINKKISTLYCAIMLLLSGFTVEDVLCLKWSELEFVRGYIDFTIIHIRKEHVVVSKHDYSRPAIPDAAKYLLKVYKDLCSKHGKEIVNKWYVATTDTSHNKSLDRKILAETANNLLVRAGFEGRLSEAGRPGIKTPIPITLFRDNYKRMLISKCGLKSDPDTYHFLAALQFKSSTYTNYESHTSPEAQYRLYTILKPFSVEEKLRKPKTLCTTKDGLVYTALPNTNHEVVRVIGDIVLNPGEKIIIRCPHGVTGRIQIT